MKNIFKSIIAIALLTGFTSCEEESNFAYVDVAAPTFKMITPISGGNVTLNETTPNNIAIAFTWDQAQYTTPTTITYTLQIAPNGSDFSNAQDLGETTSRNISVTNGQLNVPALTAGAVPFVATALDFRIKATVGGSQLPTYSDVITYNVTTFGCLGQYAVGAGIPSAGWSWSTPFEFICDDNIQTGTTGLINGTFRFFTENGNWATGRNYPYYVGQGYKIVSVLEDALDGDNNFRFTGTPGNYQIKINENDKTIGLARRTGPTSAPEPTSYWLVGAATPGGWSWNGNNETEVSLLAPGIYEVAVKLNNNDAFRVWFANDGTDGSWGSPNKNYPQFIADGYTISPELINAVDGDSNFRYVGTTGIRLFKINTITKVISLN